MSERPSHLAGKIALVVGGSSETGPHLCEALARFGAHVALTYLSRKAEAELVAERCRRLGVHSRVFPFDLLKMADSAPVVADVVSSFGGLDLLVNLGGPAPIFTDFREISENEYDLMMDAHVKGCFFLAREAARQMEKSEGGVIVNISATSSAKYSHGAYGLAKACVNEMTRFLAYSFAPRVRVFAIVPGLIDLEETEPALRRQRAAMSPLRRIVTPRELGELIEAVSSPAFQIVTGESILADGGFWLLHP